MSPALRWKRKSFEESKEELRATDERLEDLAKSKRVKHEQLVAVDAGKIVSVKNGQPVVVTAQVVGEYGSYESAAHGIKVENGDVRSESIMFD